MAGIASRHDLGKDIMPPARVRDVAVLPVETLPCFGPSFLYFRSRHENVPTRKDLGKDCVLPAEIDVAVLVQSSGVEERREEEETVVAVYISKDGGRSKKLSY